MYELGCCLDPHCITYTNVNVLLHTYLEFLGQAPKMYLVLKGYKGLVI